MLFRIIYEILFKKLCKIFCIYIKMENKKVKELKLIANQYGLHRYSKLRKAELIHLIKEHERKQELTRKAREE